MYYIGCILLFLSALTAFRIYIKRSAPAEKSRFMDVLTTEAAKGTTRSDVKSRKFRVRKLSRFWRFLY